MPRLSAIARVAAAAMLGATTTAVVVHVPSPVLAQPSQAACARGTIRLLPVDQLGLVIEEGVGYGGVRIGDSETTLLGQWGPTLCGDNPDGRDRMYAVWRAADQAIEVLFVRTQGGRVLWIGTMPAPHAGFARAIGVKTRAGVRLETPLSQVEQTYGPPEASTPAICSTPRAVSRSATTGVKSD